MSTKLNPPQIEASLPPIVITPGTPDDDSPTVDCEFTIPLYSNPAVSLGDISGLKILIKSMSNDNLILQVQRSKTNTWQFGQKITIQIQHQYSKLLTIGQYYKIQIAYLYEGENNTNDDNTNNDNTHNDDQTDNPHLVGYYSSVGISKCTALPNITITDVDGNTINEINGVSTTFKGTYKNELDSTEKVYSYCFTLSDASNKILDTSGTLLHDTTKDISGIESEDTWEPKIVLLDINEQYTIKYEIITINGLRASINYKIKPGSIASNAANMLFHRSENGHVYISLSGATSAGQYIKISAGQYTIIRTSNKDNGKWMKIKNFTLDTEKNVVGYRDYFVEQGVTYKYKIYYQLDDQNKTQGIISAYYESLPMDFEDMFLSDGERSLCIRFNPKVSSFKSTILESKMDTLGGKYPFIFRNGNVNYKEFPISGLISMTMDPDSQFMTFSDISNPSNRERTAGNLADGTDSLTNLTGNNFYKERIFKTEVLNWLTNGKPKVFRSPAEGNFIVRLMNVSLTPNDTLGRMLHTFNCTAYEVAEYNMENLEKYNLMPSTIII